MRHRARAAAFSSGLAVLILLVLPGADTARAQGTAAAAATATPVDAEETRKLHELFERHWEWSARTFPEFASYRGDHRYGDRLADASEQARTEQDRATLEFLRAARALRAERLSATDRVSLDLFTRQMQRFAEQAQFPAARGLSLGALGGPHTAFAELMQIVPLDRPERVRQAIARLVASEVRLQQEIAALRRSAAAGWVSARDVLQRSLVQIDSLLQASAGVPAHAFYQPFTRLAAELPQREALQAEARQAIAAHVVPALHTLRRFVAEELLPKAPADGSLRRYPDGERVYAMHVRHATTTDLTPQAIHDIGQRELARLRAEMEAVMREVKWEGSFASFAAHLNTDPKYFHASPEALLTGYRDIAKRLDGELPRLFAELPRVPYGIRAMPAHMGANRAEYYNGPPLDGSRAGFFYANTLAYKKRPIWAMETLVAHESVPGHHLQIARAAELRDLPPFRRSGFGYLAYVEGWALYAEALGFELGLYTDPLSRFGHLQAQAFRAARLVVDTGIHLHGWSRERAIEFMVERTGEEREFVEGEIDRYVSWPGQALGYMIGKLEFDRARDRARARLGERFDIRKFHNAVLDQGALPLATMQQLADEWIERQVLALTPTLR
jgi:uncharacterized protein (DUF885 family)